MPWNPDPRRARKPRKGAPVVPVSFLRPRVLARDRLREWKSPTSLEVLAQRTSRFSRVTVAALQNTFNSALGSGTKGSYGGGLARFHEFCDAEQISEEDRMPASEELMLMFIASWNGRVSEKTVGSWVSGVRAWHLMHGAPWRMGDALKLVKAGISKLAPSTSRLPPRPPVTTDHLSALRSSLNLSDSFDAAVYACAASCFFGIMRLGEVLPLSASRCLEQDRPFPTIHDVQFTTSHRHISAMQIHLPWTKTTLLDGATVTVTRQNDDIDPLVAMQQYLAVNSGLDPTTPLFSFRTAEGSSVMTKAWFLKRCNEVWMAAGLQTLTGHSFRIGGATEFLVRGVPPEVVAKMGRWRSDAFLTYWRRHEELLTLWTTAPQHLLSIAEVNGSVTSWHRRWSRAASVRSA